MEKIVDDRAYLLMHETRVRLLKPKFLERLSTRAMIDYLATFYQKLKLYFVGISTEKLPENRF